jgi:hypothetical protein
VVTITHKGLENFQHLGKDFSAESFIEGWNNIVGKSLRDFVESR